MRCNRCLLPDTFPGITFNEEEICSICQRTPAIEDLRIHQQELKKKMDALIDKVRGGNTYDCIVAYSGGKDSTYTLKTLVQDYKLNCLAITIDNGFIAEQAVINCRTVTAALEVDFMFFTPSPGFMNNMYRTSIEDESVHSKAAIKRASAICNSCINLINNFMLKTALEKDVPIIAGGYIGGQVPKDAALLNLDLINQAKSKQFSLGNYERLFGLGARKYFDLNEDLVNNYKFDSLAVINPMLTIPISEEEIVASISELGWAKPKDTGKNSSNCLLNDLGIAIHHKKHNFNPYIAEIAEQVRHGLMDKETALIKAESIPSFDDLQEQAQKIGIDTDAI